MLSRRFHGFTLVELLVVIAIIGILIAMLLPAIQAAREAARRMSCSGNMRQIGLAAINYESAHRYYPPCSYVFSYERREEGHNFLTFILPYIEESKIYENYHFERSWDCKMTIYPNRQTTAVPISLYKCPSAPVKTGSPPDCPFKDYYQCSADYAACSVIVRGSSDVRKAINAGVLADRGDGNDGRNNWRSILHPIFDRPVVNGVKTHTVSAIGTVTSKTTSQSDVVDGVSNSILLTEASGRAEYWKDGEYIEDLPDTGWHWADVGGWLWAHNICEGKMFNCKNNNEMYSFHPGGCQFIYGDGSVHFLSNEIELNTFVSLFTCAAEDLVDEKH